MIDKKDRRVIVVRRGAALADAWVRHRVCRPTVLGNPWSHRADTAAEHVPGASREDVIRKFETWLDALPRDSPQWQAIESIVHDVRKGYKVALECACAPLPCHADVIRVRVLTLADAA